MEENLSKLDNVLMMNGFMNWREPAPQATLDKSAKFKSSVSSAQSMQQHAILSDTSVASSTDSDSSFALSNDLLFQYVNLNLVKRMIAQNLVEILIICVIITYLIYYSSQISKRPRLIGNTRSKFVEFINKNLNDTLSRRFSPLIYFWGTNPQTALFGYLQGQTSVNEMPRTSFKRQYIYVSDAQYLVSNVDLSQHYGKGKRKSHPVQLQVHESMQHHSTNSAPSLLDQNIRLAFDEMLARKEANKIIVEGSKLIVGIKRGSTKECSVPIFVASKPVVVVIATAQSEVGAVGDDRKNGNKGNNLVTAKLKPSSRNKPASSKGLQELSSGSSSDSGVFAGDSSSSSASSSSSSSSSLTDVVISDADRCSCKLRYDDCDSNLELASCGWLSGKQASEISISTSTSKKETATTTREGSNNDQVSLPINESVNRDNSAANSGPVFSEQQEFGQCALDWHKGSHKNYHNNKLVALISAGMTTGSDKKYVTDTVKTLEQLGYEVCVFIRRGVGGLKLSSTKFFSPAKWRDFEAAVLSIRQQRPGAHLVSIGFSFGSIELCRYLAMSGKRSLVDAALLISCPFDPEAGGRNMRKRALNRRIDAYLAKNLGRQLYSALFASSQQQQQLQEQQQQNQIVVSNLSGSVVNLAKLPKIKSLVDFEENYNRIIQNYPSSEAYAADSRLQDHLGRIETPTLCLSSEDDFMAPLKLLPLDQIQANKNLCMLLTKRGGHMAFIDGIIWPKKPYFAQRIIGKYLSAVKESFFDPTGQSDCLAGLINV